MSVRLTLDHDTDKTTPAADGTFQWLCLIVAVALPAIVAFWGI